MCAKDTPENPPFMILFQLHPLWLKKGILTADLARFTFFYPDNLSRNLGLP